jgi:hypothetical protein
VYHMERCSGCCQKWRQTWLLKDWRDPNKQEKWFFIVEEKCVTGSSELLVCHHYICVTGSSELLVCHHYICVTGSSELLVSHHYICGLREKTDELINSLFPKFPRFLCFPEHHLKQLELDQTNLDGFKLGAAYCRKSLLKGEVSIFVHVKYNYINVDLSKFCK